jgi:hypothetical protein
MDFQPDVAKRFARTGVLEAANRAVGAARAAGIVPTRLPEVAESNALFSLVTASAGDALTQDHPRTQASRAEGTGGPDRAGGTVRQAL